MRVHKILKILCKIHYRNLFIWSFWTLVIVSCTIEKRKYFKGYYISKRHHAKYEKVNSIDESNSIKQKEAILNIIPFREEIVYSGNPQNDNQNSNNQLIVKSNKKYSLNDSCKDELIFKNGERLKVKIVEITPYVVRFYNCSLGSPFLSEIPKNDLSVILPHEGKAELIDDSQKSNNSKNTNNSAGNGTKIHEEVLIGLALFVMLWPVGTIYILVRYKPVRNEILSNPDKYYGKNLWDVMFFLALIISVLILIYFTFYLFLPY